MNRTRAIEVTNPSLKGFLDAILVHIAREGQAVAKMNVPEERAVVVAAAEKLDVMDNDFAELFLEFEQHVLGVARRVVRPDAVEHDGGDMPPDAHLLVPLAMAHEHELAFAAVLIDLSRRTQLCEQAVGELCDERGFEVGDRARFVAASAVRLRRTKSRNVEEQM